MAPAVWAAAGLLSLLGRPREDSGPVRGDALGVLKQPGQVTSNKTARLVVSVRATRMQ